MLGREKVQIICCRHGSTKYNSTHAGESAERIRGHLDIPLTEDGKKEARELAKKVLSDNLPIERIYSSDLSRAHETAEAIGNELGLPVEMVRVLRPWNLGYLQGTLVKNALPVMKDMIAHEDRIPRGGEAFSTFRKKVLTFFIKVAKEADRDKQTICIVTHTRDIQLIKAFIAAGAPKDMSIDMKTMESYDDEIQPSGYMMVLPGEILGSEWRDGPDNDSEGISDDESSS